MNEDDLILLSENEKEKLKKAYHLIRSVKDKISIEYEEYGAIKTTLYYLNNAINYKKKFLS